MPSSITIRNVPDETRDELAARAARSGGSLQEHLRGELVEMAHHPDLSTVLERISARRGSVDASIDAERILALRDADRG
jgi:plasmid stability protein